MFKIICVTNRTMCSDFLPRIQTLFQRGIEIILREKELSEPEYEQLAKQIIALCPNVVLHTYINVAKHLGAKRIHLPLHLMHKNLKEDFDTIGVSVHSIEEAAKAQKMGADYVTAGHIFTTDCKKGVAPRGIEFLREIVHTVAIPVYAIGGISPQNMDSICKTGAAGACIMSGFMRCENVDKYLQDMYK